MRHIPSRFDNIDLTPQPLPADLSAVTCRDALGWWIECQCTHGPNCHGGGTHKPLRLLLERYNCDGIGVLDVAKRLRCQRCGSKPSGLTLVDNAAGGIYGMRTRPSGGGKLPTRIDLLPLLAARERGTSTALQVTATTYLCPITSDDLAHDPAMRDTLSDTFGLQRPTG